MPKQQTDASQKKKHAGWLDPDSDDVRWWPSHVREIFLAIGRAMGDARLRPETLRSVPSEFGSILAEHKVEVTHVSGKTLNRRKGFYLIDVDGPRFGGHWKFSSGQLERLSRSASEA